jgi:subtilisin family serine protease
MVMKNRIFLFSLIILFTYGCSTSEQVATSEPAKPTDTVESLEPDESAEMIDFETMTEPPENWHHLDEEQTRFRGISSKLTYENMPANTSPQRQVIVAVIDGGVDINHEDLKANIWVNEDEVPGNNTDDDNNGYTDDVNGWNFIGGADGKNVDNDTFEVTRIYKRLKPTFADADTTSFTTAEEQQYELFKKVKNEYRYQINEQLQRYNNVTSLEQSMAQSDEILSQYFDGSYNLKDVQELKPQDQQQAFAKNVMSYVLENNIDSTLIAEQKKQIYEFAKYGYNPDFSSRTIVGDNYEDKSERYYGNPDVAGPDATHGTHVAGIVGAVRNNEMGMNGVAGNVRIMVVRAVPDGDERDKDVANAIRYAVDNGAHIINMSFGKSYSPYKEEVDNAIQYADKNGVLMVHAAGNSSENTDEKENYPTDAYGDYFNTSDTAQLWLSVGASSWKPDTTFAGGFSNFGDQTVDLFAPGVDIYSTIPDNKYKRNQGTSMAAPVVSGTAALLMSYFPDLSATQVRDIILKSVQKYPDLTVIIPHKANKESRKGEFSDLSVSDGVVNVYNAFRAAEQISDQ